MLRSACLWLAHANTYFPAVWSRIRILDEDFISVEYIQVTYLSLN